MKATNNTGVPLCVILFVLSHVILTVFSEVDIISHFANEEIGSEKAQGLDLRC